MYRLLSAAFCALSAPGLAAPPRPQAEPLGPQAGPVAAQQGGQVAREAPVPGTPQAEAMAAANAAAMAAREELGRPIPGERVDPSTIPPGIVEGMDAVVRRERERPDDGGRVHRARNGAQGLWVIPSRDSTFAAHSGAHYATNKWGDTRMGIGFGAVVDVAGAWVVGQYAQPVWARGLLAVGYRDGEEVARSQPLRALGAEPTWFAMDLERVDRIEIVAQAAYEGAGFYGLDDLTFTRRAGLDGAADEPADEPADKTRQTGETVVLTFDDLNWRSELTGTGYGGLTWEQGTGDFAQADVEVVHPPQAPPGKGPGLDSGGAEEDDPPAALLGGGGTLPNLTLGFAGPRLGNPGAGWLPPDTCGAVGLEHFISVVNQHISVYDKESSARLVNTSLQSFFNTGQNAGDPRVAYDSFENRWVVIASNFSASPSGVHFAYSTSDDATGTWFKTFIPFDGGSDTGAWCDYPTLGLDQHGIYMGAYMVGNNFLMSLFAVDKAPLLAPTPSLGTVSAWRQLAWEGALQPCVTHGTPPGAYVVSLRNPNSIRVRRIDPPLSAPTLVFKGNLAIPHANNPPDAPALGSTVPLDTVGTRLMNAVYRNGSVWTAHSAGAGGRASARWYEIDPEQPLLVQSGRVQDPERSFFFPAIAVNAQGHAVLGFTASSPTMYAAAWYTGRLASDPQGEMAVPVAAQPGVGPYNQASSGSNRWGDYSLSCVDPEDDLSMWTIQEYARENNNWGTWIWRLEFDDTCISQVSNYCASTATSTTNGAFMSSSGAPDLSDNSFFLEVENAPSQKFGQFYYGPGQIQTTFGDGFRCVGAAGVGTFRLAPLVQTDQLGFAAHHLDFGLPPAGMGAGQILADSTWNFQFWFRDPMGPGGSGFNLSDGLSVTFCE